MTNKSVYIGDGVYAEFDGYGIWLKTSGYDVPTNKIYLEPAVWDALLQFVERLPRE